jgi:hypothetical protein
MQCLILILAILNFKLASAGSLIAPFDLENTNILTKNVNSVRVRAVRVGIDEAFDSNGQRVDLGAKLNRPMTWKEITGKADANPGGPGSTTGNVNANLTVLTPTYTRGITDNTTFILAVPIYTVNINASTGFAPNALFEPWLDSMKSNPQQQDAVRKKMANPINGKLGALGYKPIRSRSFQEVGDVRIGAKSVWAPEDQDVRYSVKYLLSVPTGTAPDADELVDMPTGDGGYTLSTNAVAEYRFAGRYSVLPTVGAAYQFADSLERRIPVMAGESISPDKEQVERKRGNQYTAGISAMTGSWTQGFALSAGYNYQYMEPTKFSGSQFSKERYGYLEDLNPSQSLQTATMVLQYSSIDSYKANKAQFPLTFSVSYTNAFAGRNAQKSDLVSSELIMYF